MKRTWCSSIIGDVLDTSIIQTFLTVLFVCPAVRVCLEDLNVHVTGGLLRTCLGVEVNEL